MTADEDEVKERQEAYRRRKSGHNILAQGRSRGEAPSAAVVNQLRTVLNQSDSSEDEDVPLPEEKNCTREYSSGMANYRQFREQELSKAVKPGWFGGLENKAKEEDNGSRRTRAGPPKRKHSKLRNETLIARQLQMLPTFTPYFIYFISFVQFAMSVSLFALAYSQSAFAPMGLGYKTETCSGIDCPDSFNGSTITVTRRVEQNFLYGPKGTYLLKFGAKLTPCMRKDTEGLLLAANERSTQCGFGWGLTCDSNSPTAGYGCCSLSSARKGMTSYSTCMATDPLASWNQGTLCSNSRDFIVIRPCCAIAMDTSCSLVTSLECSYRGGIWHSTGQLCSLTMCLGDLCQMYQGDYPITADTSLPNQPATSNQYQWFRFILPLFVHAGVIQLFIILSIQLYAGCEIEKSAGFLRTLLIYFICGIGGYAISGIFIKSQVTTGADPAVYGLLAVLLVELFQSWQIVPNRWWEFSKLGGLILVLLMIGTLPYIDNWSHVGGFCFGVVSGIVLLPYVTFGDWDLGRKRILVAVCAPLLLLMIILAFVTFYKLQTTTFCSWCKYLNCIPYSSQVSCDD